MQNLLNQIRQCDLCKEHLPYGPRPIVEASKDSKIVLISQAPGRVVHESGIAWNDQSGKKLREWLNVDEDTFYNTDNFAILPMGFCYPGKAKTGDKPPMKICAPTWHDKVWNDLQNVQLKILIGGYSQSHYLPDDKRNLTQKVIHYTDYLPEFFVMPHPSPVNRFWRMKNPWFEEELVPVLQKLVSSIIK